MNKKQKKKIIAGIIIVGAILLITQLQFNPLSITDLDYRYTETLTSDSYSAIVKSTDGINKITFDGFGAEEVFSGCLSTNSCPPNSGYFVVSKIEQTDVLNNDGTMSLSLNTYKKTNAPAPQRLPALRTVLISDLNLDFKNIGGLSFNYQINGEINGNPSGWGMLTNNIHKIGLTSSKREIILVDFSHADELTEQEYYSGIRKSGAYTEYGSFNLDLSKIDIPADTTYDLFIFGNIGTDANYGTGDYRGDSNAKLNLELTNLNIMQKSTTETPTQPIISSTEPSTSQSSQQQQTQVTETNKTTAFLLIGGLIALVIVLWLVYKKVSRRRR